jgi:hypothetical protein
VYQLPVSAQTLLETRTDVGPFRGEDAVDVRVSRGAVSASLMVTEDAVSPCAECFECVL